VVELDFLLGQDYPSIILITLLYQPTKEITQLWLSKLSIILRKN